MEDTIMKKWVCPVCGYVHEGDVPPAECPVCHVSGDKFNPQVAARLARALENWRRYEPTLSNLMYKALKYVSEEKNLSPNVREIIEHALTEPV